ncbi:hypothetical protein [Sutterella sp.]|uniref:diaminopimelate decarboxylase family protein n=1 Tax=Sutterella sp. TaxID=1981025 RepID=UPI0026E074E1|nr:hypothetical protein [Sutterella sp.]MDO5532841.1 hypothetical protein [Sutterella sp.]
MNAELIETLAREHGSLYLYDQAAIERDALVLKRDFAGFGLLYSVKANPADEVLATLLGLGFGADAASAAEVVAAVREGLPRELIQYSAPGKTRRDIEIAIEQATIVADSLAEIERIREVAEARGLKVGIGVRVNPEFSYGGTGGVPSKFGIDEDQLFKYLAEASADGAVRVTGLHVHVASQVLDTEALEGCHRYLFDLVRRVRAAAGGKLEFLNLGSGIGIPYGAGDPEVDTARLGAAAQALLAEFRKEAPETKVYLETGRFVACRAGYYITTVLDRKVSHGKTFLILANTLNGFYKPSITRMVKKYAAGASPAGCEPLYTRTAEGDAFRILTLKPLAAPTEKVTLVGNLCTAADVAAEDVELPRLEPGDVVAFTNAGTYAAVLSPMQFAQLPRPAEIFLGKDGRAVRCG